MTLTVIVGEFERLLRVSPCSTARSLTAPAWVNRCDIVYVDACPSRGRAITAHEVPRLCSIRTTWPAWEGVTRPVSTTGLPAATDRKDADRPTSAWTVWLTVGLWSPFVVTYHFWSALTDPRFIVILYCPALSVVVCVTWWKLDWPESSRHSTTVAPATGLLVSPPEITTCRPAVDGSGEAAIVKPVGVHAVQHVVVQHVVDVQQVPLVGVGQHGTKFGRVALCCPPLVGSGQHV